MGRLKSRTGCLTCLTRRKKCDEATPTCKQCERLGLSCVSRQGGSRASLSSTNLRRKTVVIPVAVSNGYPAFQSDLEKHLAAASPTIMHPMISRMAGPQFKTITLLGRLCTQSKLVRDAIVAFSAYGRTSMSDDSFQVSLKSYQSCIGSLQSTKAYEIMHAGEVDHTLTAIFFLGLLEGLTLGDPSASVAHFEVCRRLLSHRLSQPAALEDLELVDLYRMVAECVMYNFATLSPFHQNIRRAVKDWGTSFDCLFPEDDDRLSPFFGGLHEVYHVMFRINVLLRRSASSAKPIDQEEQYCSLWQRLDRLEHKIPNLYRQYEEDPDTTGLYRAKHRLFIHALRIQLIKISRPSAASSDTDVKLYFSKAVNVIKRQDIREPNNPSLRWPLTILACAADTDEDFEFMKTQMQEIECIVDVANSRKIASAYSTLQRFRGASNPDGTMSFLLDPRDLDSEGTRVESQLRILALPDDEG